MHLKYQAWDAYCKKICESEDDEGAWVNLSKQFAGMPAVQVQDRDTTVCAPALSHFERQLNVCAE